ncbi:unnamed protein product [Candidula unifasciata]|uniref:Protein rolling stone n=1 Tax=Candidula unifasciata TaxID=100452 RepID=A0A8S3YZZ2_9EUPU|nr:unnamed protein product [Candidula unifasciata]
MSLREEFRVRKILFSGVATERFCVFQWRTPGLVYVIYRIVMAVYPTVWLALTSTDFQMPEVEGFGQVQAWGAYLTNWTYTLLTIYFLLHALVTLIVYILCRGAGLQLMHSRRPEDHKRLFHETLTTSHGYEEIHSDGGTHVVVADQGLVWLHNSIPFYMAIIWILFNAVSVAAVMVTLVFWAILVPYSNVGFINNANIQLHLVNSILVLIEHLVTAIPVRLLHVVYPIIYGLIYVFFSLFYWVDDHSHVMYFILDWGKPGETIGYIILVGFVIIPIIHLIMYGIYRLKIRMFKKVYRD